MEESSFSLGTYLALCEKSVVIKNGVVIAILLAAGLLAPAATRAERVGYKFVGTMNTSEPVSLFGFTVEPQACVTGSFAYDVTTPVVELGPGARRYPQYITGGFTMHVDDGAIEFDVAASEYRITLYNDTTTSTTAKSDWMLITYANYNVTPIPSPVTVDGIPWDGLAAMAVQLIWPFETFPSPNEPTLEAGRPITPLPYIFSHLGSGNAPASGIPVRAIVIPTSPQLKIEAISERVGDYNFDAKVDASDYQEWRKAFSLANPAAMYADGNHDGEVSAADYVVWRNSQVVPDVMNLILSVPEPGSLALLCMSAAVLSAASARRRG